MKHLFEVILLLLKVLRNYSFMKISWSFKVLYSFNISTQKFTVIVFKLCLQIKILKLNKYKNHHFEYALLSQNLSMYLECKFIFRLEDFRYSFFDCLKAHTQWKY